MHRWGNYARRIIPARAGFTRENEADRAGLPDHPRSRGVYFGLISPKINELGSSPLARGLRCVAGEGPLGPRIIPARAGFTGGSCRNTAPIPDHPRSRGVYIKFAIVMVGLFGSSPLARGLRRLRTKMREIMPDHPRSRGVYSGVSDCSGWTW